MDGESNEDPVVTNVKPDTKITPILQLPQSELIFLTNRHVPIKSLVFRQVKFSQPVSLISPLKSDTVQDFIALTHFLFSESDRH